MEVSPPTPSAEAAVPEDEDRPQLEPLPDGPNVELYFGIVRALGTPTRQLHEALGGVLREANFLVREIRLEQLDDHPVIGSSDWNPRNRYLAEMQAGDLLRAETGKADALAIEAIHRLARDRADARKQAHDQQNRGIAWIFRNLMHPAEVRTLRRIYRRQFFLISIFAPEDLRIRRLALQLADDDSQLAHSYTSEATALIKRDQGILEGGTTEATELAHKKPFVLNVGATYHLADLFLDARDIDDVPAAERPLPIKEEVERFVELLFSNPFHVPTRAEAGMGHAYQASLQTMNLSRAVGAALTSEEGDLLGTGTNETPRAGGGVYAEGDALCNRDFDRGFDTSDRTRRSVLRDLLTKIAEADILRREGESIDPDVLNAMLSEVIRHPVTRGSQFFDILEFGRTLHAEMDAITSAARRGIPTRGATLYCTTLPCHECARLIVGAGIRKVVFVEPFDKTRAFDLYDEEIYLTTRSENPPSDPKVVQFVPYAGISPTRFFEFFSWVPRKADDLLPASERTLDGKVRAWALDQSDIRESIAYMGSLMEPTQLTAVRTHEFNEWRNYSERVRAAVARRRAPT